MTSYTVVLQQSRLDPATRTEYIDADEHFQDSTGHLLHFIKGEEARVVYTVHLDVLVSATRNE